MGDMSELRGLIVVGTFVGVLVILIGLIPYGFIMDAQDYEGRTINPTYFEAISLEQYATNYTYPLNGTSASLSSSGLWGHSVKIGGHDLGFYYPEANSTIDYILRIDHWERWALLVYNPHPCSFRSVGVDYGTKLEKTELNSLYENKSKLNFQFYDAHIELDLFFGFDSSLYDTPEDAHNHYDLQILIGVTWDQIATTMSAWDVLALVLFFQLPGIHPLINAIIAIPIYLCIGYLAFILILRAVGAIFGGGA